MKQSLASKTAEASLTASALAELTELHRLAMERQQVGVEELQRSVLEKEMLSERKEMSQMASSELRSELVELRKCKETLEEELAAVSRKTIETSEDGREKQREQRLSEVELRRFVSQLQLEASDGSGERELLALERDGLRKELARYAETNRRLQEDFDEALKMRDAEVMSLQGHLEAERLKLAEIWSEAREAAAESERLRVALKGSEELEAGKALALEQCEQLRRQTETGLERGLEERMEVLEAWWLTLLLGIDFCI